MYMAGMYLKNIRIKIQQIFDILEKGTIIVLVNYIHINNEE